MVVVEVCFASFAYSQELLVSLQAVTTTTRTFASTSSRSKGGIITSPSSYLSKLIAVQGSFSLKLIEAKETFDQ